MPSNETCRGKTKTVKVLIVTYLISMLSPVVINLITNNGKHLHIKLFTRISHENFEFRRFWGILERSADILPNIAPLNKCNGVRSEDRGGRNLGLPLPVHLLGKQLFRDCHINVAVLHFVERKLWYPVFFKFWHNSPRPTNSITALELRF